MDKLWAAIALLAVLMASALPAGAAPVVEFKDNRLTVQADNDSLLDVLSRVARKTNIVIFMSEEFKPGKITASLNRVPLEEAFKKLLRQYNCVTIYNRQGENFVVTALKIYPEGQSSSGSMKTLITDSVTENTDISSRSDQADYTPGVPGTTLPGEYVRYALKKEKTLVQAAHGFEKKEQEASREINELREKISQTNHFENKDALTLELVNSMTRFETMQRNHTNAMESLYRAALFKKERRNGTD